MVKLATSLTTSENSEEFWITLQFDVFKFDVASNKINKKLVQTSTEYATQEFGPLYIYFLTWAVACVALKNQDLSDQDEYSKIYILSSHTP